MSRLWLRAEYLNGQEAADDFHALISAMKKVLKGKWVMNGISKGGATTAIQQALHPEDFNLFMPYAGPLMDGMADTGPMRHTLDVAWSDEMREYMRDLKRYALLTPEVFEIFKDWHSYYRPGYSDEYWKNQFLGNVHMIDCDVHAYTSRADAKKIIDRNKQLIEQLTAKGVDKNELITLLFYYNELKGEEAWKNELSSAAGVKRRSVQGRFVPEKVELERRLPLPSDFSQKMWNRDGSQPYYYQALREHGYYGPDFRMLLTEDDEQEAAEEMNRIWAKRTKNYIVSSSSYLRTVEYDPTLRQKTWEATLHNKAPMIYIYGQDDYWTGSGVPDDMVNGTETFKYILSAQNHNVKITNATAAERTELWNKVDLMLKIVPTDIEEVTTDTCVDASHPRAIYNLRGQRVASPRSGEMYIVDGMKRVW